MVPTAPRIARTRKEKLFAGFNFLFLTTASFTGCQFTKMEVMVKDLISIFITTA